MNYSSSNKDEIEYQLGLKDRKRDAKLRMQQTAKIMNGEFRIGIFDGVVGKAKKIDTSIQDKHKK